MLWNASNPLKSASEFSLVRVPGDLWSTNSDVHQVFEILQGPSVTEESFRII